MSYVKTPNLVRVAGEKHDAYVSSLGEGLIYADLVWESTPVAEATLLASQIEMLREEIELKIRTEASDQRHLATQAILGTIDPEQLRTYEEKYVEASNWIVSNISPTPIMDAEILHTGETIETLAPLVVAEYEAAKNILRGLYGNLEGIRRINLNIVKAYTLLSELEAYAGPTW